MSALRRALVVAAVLLFGCGHHVATSTEDAAHARGWTRVSPALAPHGEVRPLVVSGRTYARRFGVGPGHPVIAADGTHVAWLTNDSVVVRDVASAESRAVRLLAGEIPADAAFVGARYVGVRSDPAVLGRYGLGTAPATTDTPQSLTIYDLATLAPVVTYVQRNVVAHGCTRLVGTTRELLCIGDSDIVAFEPATLRTRAVPLPRPPVTGRPGYVAEPAVSADSARLLYAAAGARGVVEVVDLVHGTATSFTVPVERGSDGIVALGLAPDGAHVAVATLRGVTVRSVPSGRQVGPARTENGGPPMTLALSPALIAFVGSGFDTVVAGTHGQHTELGMACPGAESLVVTRGRVITASADGLCVYDASTDALRPRESALAGYGPIVWEGDTLHRGDPGTRFDVTSGTVTAIDPVPAAGAPPRPLDVSADGTRAIVPLPDRQDLASLVDTASHDEITRVDLLARFLPSGRAFVDLRDGALVLRASRDGAHHGAIDVPGRFLDAVAVTPDDRHVLASMDGRLQIIAVATGATVATLPQLVTTITVRPDGAEAVLGVEDCTGGVDGPCDGRLMRISVPSGGVLGSLTLDAPARAITYSPTRDALAVGSDRDLVLVSLSEGWTDGSPSSAHE